MAKKHEKIIALIVAGGSGSRTGSVTPKQYIKLKGKEILAHTVEAFAGNANISGVQVVIGKGHEKLYSAAVSSCHYRVGGNLYARDLEIDNKTSKPVTMDSRLRGNDKLCSLLPPVIGGKTRAESVRLGLLAIAKHKPDKVLIHDAARPFISREIIDGVIVALKKNLGAIPVIGVNDTLKHISNKITKTVDKSTLALAQTPQGFDYKTILDAHKKAAGKNFTDDAAVLEHFGIPVSVIPGDSKNFKITDMNDIERAKAMMGREIRTGMGFDVHSFTGTPKKGNNILICGVKIPYERQLAGHSDADVGLHAIVDSLLGAISAGDIGEHFPPSDKKWKNADSSIFLAHAGKLLRERQAKINNIDVTIIAEAPKIAPHRAEMRSRIAAILEIPLEKISVKATTTEGLGFAGRKEGIAAQAIATIEI